MARTTNTGGPIPTAGMAPTTTGTPAIGTPTTTTTPAPPVETTNPVSSGTGGQAGSFNAEPDALTQDDFKKDGSLRKSSVKGIEEHISPRGSQRSFNEVTGQTTVTTHVGGKSVTFTEDGDTRGDGRRERATDSAIRAMDNANKESK